MQKSRKTSNKKGKENKQLSHPFGGGGVKSVQEPVPLFPTNEFQNPQNFLFAWRFPQVGGDHFLQKRTMLKGGDFERAKNMITVFGCFRDKLLRNPRKGG